MVVVAPTEDDVVGDVVVVGEVVELGATIVFDTARCFEDPPSTKTPVSTAQSTTAAITATRPVWYLENLSEKDMLLFCRSSVVLHSIFG